MRILFTLLLASSVCFLAAHHAGEVTTEIKGKVIDATSGEAIEGAQVELMNYMPKNIDESNEDGTFSLRGVPTGLCRIRVSAEGYTQQVVSDIEASSDAAAEVEVKLEPR